MTAKKAAIARLRLFELSKNIVMQAKSNSEFCQHYPEMIQIIQSTPSPSKILTGRKCIHLQDCFDYRNHICIVTELLGMSVFDFLKGNNFIPFLPAHVQHFAKQLLESVACIFSLLSSDNSFAFIEPCAYGSKTGEYITSQQWFLWSQMQCCTNLYIIVTNISVGNDRRKCSRTPKYGWLILAAPHSMTSIILIWWALVITVPLKSFWVKSFR